MELSGWDLHSRGTAEPAFRIANDWERLAEAVNGDIDIAHLLLRSFPLHQDGALVGALYDFGLAVAVVRYQQAGAAFHP